MVIKAITPPLVRNNQVNFTSGKVGHDKRTGSNNGYSMPDCKAVPLAVLIAMSPLNASAVQNTPVNEGHNIELVSDVKTDKTQQDGKVISTKAFKISPPTSVYEYMVAPLGYDVNVDVIKKNDGTIGVQLKMDNQKTKDLYLAIVNSYIQADNGVEKGYLNGYVHCSYPDGEPSGNYYFGNNELVEYMASLKQQYPDAVRTERVEAHCGVSEQGIVSEPNGDIIRTATEYKPKSQIRGIAPMPADNWTSFARLYSTDEDPDNMEIVTLKLRPSVPELRIKEVVVHEDFLRKDDYSFSKDNTVLMRYNEVVLTDANGQDYRVLDDKLAQSLSKFLDKKNRKGEPIVNGSYTVRKAEPAFYELLPDGKIFRLEQSR